MFFSFPVLMYHSISRYKDPLSVAPEQFDEHCRSLAQAGWRGIPLGEAEEYFLRKKRMPRKSCLLTFDDGYLDNYVHAEPILRHYGHYGVIFPVAKCLGSVNAPRRPTKETNASDSQPPPSLPNLDARPPVVRSGRRVRRIRFCNWNEIQWMHHQGHMAAAPHSLRHDRVVRSLRYTQLFVPRQKLGGFFGGPPYEMPIGFPVFELGHSLTGPGYRIVPEVFELARRLVPQDSAAGSAFLADEKNRSAVRAAFDALPCLGVLESETEYRARIFRDFASCRAIFAKQLGTAPVSFCWPWGAYSEIALEEAQKAGFRLFFTTMRGSNSAGRALDVRRMRGRAVSGERLLAGVRLASMPLFETIYGWVRRAVVACSH